jgi:hypothetical protein
MDAFAECAVTSRGVPTKSCILSYFPSAGLCISNIDECGNGCEQGAACCGEPCAQGIPSQNCPYLHCSDGVACCNGFSCCDNGSDCCGSRCLEGLEQGFTCRQPGDIVCDPGSGDTCGQGGCCGADRPRCRSTSPPLCCEDGAGDVCAHGAKCCPAGSPTCLSDRVCCNSGDILCDPASGTSCCPQPGTCVGGQCCNPPNAVCGSACCGPQEVCTPKRNVCCGGPDFVAKICGDDCCGPSETCLVDFCCPTSQVCNGVCCPSGQTCLNGSCSACGAGTVPCRSSAQDPIFCCENTKACGPTGCCPPFQVYCGDGRCAFNCAQ